MSFGDPDGEDFAFTKCDADGTFTLSGLPDGDWRITVFDQWNDMLVDGLSTPVRLAGGATVNLGDLATNQWQANIYTSTFFDANKNGLRDPDEAGLSLVPTNIRFRDGSYSNFNNTDLTATPASTKSSRCSAGTSSKPIAPVTRTPEPTWFTTPAARPTARATCHHRLPVRKLHHWPATWRTAMRPSRPANLRVPGAVYCADGDCTRSRSQEHLRGVVQPVHRPHRSAMGGE